MTGSSVVEHRFGAGAPYTLGVEEEYMLLDPEIWDLVQHIDSILSRGKKSYQADGKHCEQSGVDPDRPFVNRGLALKVPSTAAER